MLDKEISLKEQEILRSRLKERRLFLEMTYQELADKTGMSKSTLQRYETGAIKNLAYDKIYILSKALDVDPTYFINLSTDYTSYETKDSYLMMKEERANYTTKIKEIDSKALKILTPYLISHGYKVEQRDRGSIGDLVAIRGGEVWHIDFMYTRDVNKYPAGMGMGRQQLLLRFGRLAVYNKPITKYSILVEHAIMVQQLMQSRPIHISVPISIIVLHNDTFKEIDFK